MNKPIITIFFIIALIVSGCATSQKDGLNPTEPKACTKEAKICPDGTSVSRNPNNNCEFYECPIAKTCVDGDNEYKSCPDGTKPVDRVCVNGEWVSINYLIDPCTSLCEGLNEQECTSNNNCRAAYGPSYCDDKTCTTDQQYKGCQVKVNSCNALTEEACIANNCRPIYGPSYCDDKTCTTDLQYKMCEEKSKFDKVIYCTEPRPSECTIDHNPVCGYVDSQCAQEPCYQEAKTFANKCEACANSLTTSYVKGTCEEQQIIYDEEYCCGSYDETTGKTRYWISTSSTCGIPEGVACPGSCGGVVNDELCLVGTTQ